MPTYLQNTGNIFLWRFTADCRVDMCLLQDLGCFQQNFDVCLALTFGASPTSLSLSPPPGLPHVRHATCALPCFDKLVPTAPRCVATPVPRPSEQCSSAAFFSPASLSGNLLHLKIRLSGPRRCRLTPHRAIRLHVAPQHTPCRLTAATSASSHRPRLACRRALRHRGVTPAHCAETNEGVALDVHFLLDRASPNS